jgi:hypothetical protein
LIPTLEELLTLLEKEMDTSDFNEEERRYLEQEYLIQPVASPGKLKVNLSFLDPSLNSIFGPNSSTIPLVPVCFTNHSSGHTLEIPASPVSTEAVEYLGFTPQCASEIFSSWTKRPDPFYNPYSLADYACGHVYIVELRQNASLDYRQAMTKAGIGMELQNTLLKPEFSGIFHTRTLHFWLNDTIRKRFAILEGLH